jgi:polyisoprenoid-binding protein YceI
MIIHLSYQFIKTNINLKIKTMKKIGLIIGLGILVAMSSFRSDGTKVITKTGHIIIFSHTAAEDINANNYKATSTLDPASGVMVFSVPMQGFEFEKSLMQKHFNSPKFLDTKQFPKAKFKGAITNITAVTFTKDGSYSVIVKGDLTMHGITKTLSEKGEITVKGGVITATSKFNIVLADYKIAFEKGKPSTNIAKEVELTINMNYKAS